MSSSTPTSASELEGAFISHVLVGVLICLSVVFLMVGLIALLVAPPQPSSESINTNIAPTESGRHKTLLPQSGREPAPTITPPVSETGSKDNKSTTAGVHEPAASPQPVRNQTSQQQSTIAAPADGKQENTNHETAPALKYVTKETFNEEVWNHPEPVFVMFTTSWCGYCKRLAPVLRELAVSNPGAKIVKIDAGQQPELKTQFSVSRYPTVLLFHKKKLMTTIVGAKSRDRYVAALTDLK